MKNNEGMKAILWLVVMLVFLFPFMLLYFLPISAFTGSTSAEQEFARKSILLSLGIFTAVSTVVNLIMIRLIKDKVIKKRYGNILLCIVAIATMVLGNNLLILVLGLTFAVLAAYNVFAPKKIANI